MNMKPRHLHRQLLQQKQRRRHGNNPQRRERRAGFHRSMAAAILVLATTLSSLPMTSATAHPTTYSYSSPPTSTVPQHQCLIPDDDNACISSSSASLMLQSSSICHDERRHNRHSYPRVGTPTLSLSTQCLNTTIHHCRGGSRSADNANDHQQTEEEDQGTSENSDKSSSTLSHHHRKYYFPPKAITTRLVIEFDTHAIMSGSSSGGGVFPRRGTTSLRNRIGTRIGGTDDANNYWTQRRRRRRRHLSTHTHANRQFPSLSISFDVNPATTTPSSSATTVIEGGNSTAAWHESNNTFRNDDKSSQEEQQQQYRSCSNNAVPVRPLLLAPTILTLLTQTATLLPPLILARRTLNMTWTAIVDYFRGRTIRTTFTKMERAYLRYYEFPAVTRAMARIGSQIGILLSLSWGVRLWMIWVCSSSGSGSSSDVSWPTSMVLGVTGFDAMRSSVGMSSSSSSILLGPGLKVGLPCHQRGKGIAWLCGFIWIGAVVGIGHACAMAVSRWLP